jgi:enamine deaminase RidA (YjgF/YER057c/UK114 family)
LPSRSGRSTRPALLATAVLSIDEHTSIEVAKLAHSDLMVEIEVIAMVD